MNDSTRTDENANKSWLNQLGFVVLLAMLVLSFFSLFPVMAMMDQDQMPADFNLGWVMLFTFAVLFPVMAAHIHTAWLYKRIGKISWWFWISNATLAGLLVYAWFRRESTHSYRNEDETVSWFFACYVGGTLGALLMFAVIRRFAPSWLGFQKPESKRVKPKLSLKTLFFWLTSVGVLCGAFVNQEQLMLVEKNALPLPLWPLFGAFNMGIFCLVVVPLVTFWLRKTEPFWLAGSILIVLSILVPIAVAAVITIFTVFYGTESSEVSLAATALLTTASLVAVPWYAACRWAGLVCTTNPSVERTGIRKLIARMFGLLGATLKYAGSAVSVAALIYLAGWGFVHFKDGPERDPQLVMNEIAKSIGGELEDGEDWIELVNRKNEVPKDKNLAVALLRVSNPFRFELQAGEHRYRKENGQPLLTGYDETVAAYMTKLGVSENEFFEFPSIDVQRWFDDRHEEYRLTLLKKFPSLESFGDYYDEDEEFDEGGEFGMDESIAVDFAEQQSPSRELVLAEYFWDLINLDKRELVAAPWSKEDYPVGAEFLEAHQSQIESIRELSNRVDIYSPLVRETAEGIRRFDLELFDEAMFLLRASGYYKIGSGDIAGAIEDCEALWRLRDLSDQIDRKTGVFSLFGRHVVSGLGEAIAFSGKANVNQLRRILKARLQQPSPESMLLMDNTLRRARLKDEILRYVLPRNSESRDIFYMDGPISGQYVRFPNLVDWNHFNTEFDRNFEQTLNAAKLSDSGELGFEKYTESIWDITCVSFPNGNRMGKEVYYSVFGAELLAFVKGPQAKGQILAEKTAAILEIYGIYAVRARRALGETAMALQVYRELNGEYPKSLSDLVPGVLAKVKQDPYSKDELIYDSNGEWFTLYSVFRNGVDDQGVDGGDLSFQIPARDLVDYIERQ